MRPSAVINALINNEKSVWLDERRVSNGEKAAIAESSFFFPPPLKLYALSGMRWIEKDALNETKRSAVRLTAVAPPVSGEITVLTERVARSRRGVVLS